MPDFDWKDDADCIVQHSTPTVAVFTNTNGDIVIRKQREDMYEEHDAFIVISRGNARTVAQAILDAAEVGPDAVVVPAEKAEPKDRTAAERAKRYRDSKKRHGDDRDATVTERDATVTDDEPVDLLSRALLTEKAGADNE
jgi:hypothetical protein